MDLKHHRVLRQMQPKIVHDVNISNIIDVLISKGVVEDSLWDDIQREASQMAQNRKLLTELPKRGPNAYFVFKEALRPSYYWISEAMDHLERAEDSVDSLDAPQGFSPQSLLPANPPLTVKRSQKTDQLRNGLRELKPESYLALHALQGYGKSTLAAATLKDKTMLEELFQNEIYWINFGQRQKLEENILTQLNILFHQVKNWDLLTEPTSKESLKYSLKRHFSEHSYALLILDDVNSKEIIDDFDFGCKTLVLTTDMDVLKGRKNKVIKMIDGFSLNESLDLFAKATGIPVKDLPPQAREIHYECKGMPLMISMFSAQFEDIKESLAERRTSNDIWSYYLNALKEKKPIILQDSLEQLTTTLKICIERLSEDDQKFFKTLAIFPEDVNITTQTLSIFWGVPGPEVDSRMCKLCKKSLACREWHECFKSYIYGIHNLVLHHLRDTTDPEILRDTHRKYVERNLHICNGDFSKLPSDNYIYSYIGYHMEKGQMKDKFCDIYSDFSFIEAKIFHVGPGDLLIDLKKYRSEITRRKPELIERVEDLERFLIQQASTLAEYRKRNCLDLIQVALKHPFPGFVRAKAEQLAKERESQLYLYHLKHSKESFNSASQELHLKVLSVAFTNEAEVILVGNDRGEIVMWNCNSRDYVAFHGNSREHPIAKIVVPKDAKFFVSLSKDGNAKRFELPGDSEAQQNNYSKTIHPRVKQPEWRSMSDVKSNQDDSKATFSVEGQKILDLAVSTDGTKIAACTNTGFVAIWDSSGRKLIEPQPGAKTPLTSVAFMMCSTVLYTLNKSVGSVVVLETLTGRYKTQFSFHPETDEMISLLSVPSYSNVILVLLATKLIRVMQKHIGDQVSGPEKTKFARLGDKSQTYTCAAVTRDGKFAVTADTGGSVNVFDIHGSLEVLKTYKNLVFCLDTLWLEDTQRHVICGGNRDSLVPMIHKWEFDPKEDSVVRRLPLFDVTMESGERTVIAVATSNKTVQIIQNDEEIAETSAVEGRITDLVLSEDGNRVVYATDNGSVSIFDVKLNGMDNIFQLHESVEFLKVLKIYEKDVIVCGFGKQDLQIWNGPKKTQLVEHGGAVIFCDLLISEQLVLTVAEKEMKLWDSVSTTWCLHSKKCISQIIPTVISCTLSQGQNYLALANAHGNVTMLKLKRQETLPSIVFDEHWTQKFDSKVTAHSFSNDEKLLAIGFKGGEIMILSVKSGSEIHKLNLHRHPVKQLYWSPSSLGEMILVSLSNELAWWRVSPKSPEPEENSATSHFSQSLSEMTLAQRDTAKVANMRASKSLDLSNTQIMKTFRSHEAENFRGKNGSCSSLTDDLLNLNGDSRRVFSRWGEKRPKYSMIPDLLGVVKIDGDLANKVCVSGDFTNFVTINGEGSIYNLKIFEKRNEETDSNGDA